MHFLRKLFFYLYGNLRRYRIYFYIMKFFLNFKLKNNYQINVVYDNSSNYKEIVYDFSDITLKKESFDFYDSRELKFIKHRLNYLFDYYPTKLLISYSAEKNINHNLQSFKRLDTYSLSELLVNYSFLHSLNSFPIDYKLLAKCYLRINSRLEFHAFGQTNNHFLRNIIAVLVSSVAINDKKTFTKYSNYLSYFISNYFSKSGLLKHEKSTNYQSLFLKWQLQIVYIFNYYRIKTDYTDFFISNISNHLANFLNVLKFQINIGDITPDVNSINLYNSLKILSNSILISSNENSFFDEISGHGMIYFENKSIVYFIQEINFYKSSHGHSPSMNYVLNKNGQNLVSDLGRLNYSKEFNFQTNANNHNAVFFIEGYKPIYLDYVYSNSSDDCICFKSKSLPNLSSCSNFRILNLIDGFSLNYEMNLSKPARIFIILIISKSAKYQFFGGLRQVNCEQINSAIDYGRYGDTYYRLTLESSDISLSYNFTINILN